MTPPSALLGKTKAFLSLKYRRRLLTVAKNSLHSLTLPIFSIIVSYLVVKRASVELWGEFVQVMIFVQLGAHIINWGNKEYLLREFSRSPAQIATVWQSSLFTRFVLLAPFCVVLAIADFSASLTLFMVLWTAALVLFQSYDVFVVYHRDFLFAMFVEVVGLLVMAMMVYIWDKNTTVLGLTALFAVVFAAKALVLTGRFRASVHASAMGRQQSGVGYGRFQPTYFSLALPFFLLGLTGMLQSRIDLYSVNYFLPNTEVGQYQVFINLMIYIQAISAFILVPFIKSIYRLNSRAILKMSTRLFALGCILVVPMLALAYFTIKVIYGFELPSAMFLLGGLFVIPIYFYLPVIYALYKTNRQWQVIWVNLFGLGVNLGLNLLLVPRLGMVGAMMGSAVAQWGMWLIYGWLSRNIRAEVGNEATVPELS
ncbi:MAG: polysaccharide biosynthesis C-terminal domain-containing protein [Anaerolineae bacterium]|nr:polysaccharide biosynthesis C-terminal domain-containing protein [Anaerolineae bacterium]